MTEELAYVGGVAVLLAEAIACGKAIYVLGNKNCEIFKTRLYNHTKGMALINPIWHTNFTYKTLFKKDDIVIITTETMFEVKFKIEEIIQEMTSEQVCMVTLEKMYDSTINAIMNALEEELKDRGMRLPKI